MSIFLFAYYLNCFHIYAVFPLSSYCLTVSLSISSVFFVICLSYLLASLLVRLIKSPNFRCLTSVSFFLTFALHLPNPSLSKMIPPPPVLSHFTLTLITPIYLLQSFLLSSLLTSLHNQSRTNSLSQKISPRLPTIYTSGPLFWRTLVIDMFSSHSS